MPPKPNVPRAEIGQLPTRARGSRRVPISYSTSTDPSIVRNLAGMTGASIPHPVNVLDSTNDTMPQTLHSYIDPSLLSLPNPGYTSSEEKIAPAYTQRFPPTERSTHQHAQVQPNVPSHQPSSGVTKRTNRRKAPAGSTRSSRAKEQNLLQSLNPRLRSESITSTTRYNAATIGTQQMNNGSGADDDSASIAASKVRFRGEDGVMEWWDEADDQWSMLPRNIMNVDEGTDVRTEPARYHRDCREELIRLAAQQPGAPGKLIYPTCQVGADESSMDSGYGHKLHELLPLHGRLD